MTTALVLALFAGFIALMIGAGYALSCLSEWHARRSARKFYGDL